MALSRLMQLFGKIEDTPGTVASGLTNIANGKHLVIDPVMTFDVPLFERNIKRATLTSIEGLTGIKQGTVTFQIEVAGQSIATPDIPTWDLFMKSAGFRSVSTKKVAFTGAAGGPFRHQETVTATGTGADFTAKVVHDTYPSGAGAGTIYLSNDTIVWASSGATTLTGGTSGATCSVAAGVSSSDAGQSWWPISFPTAEFTYTAANGTPFAVGTIIKGDTSAFKGIVTAHDTAGKKITFRPYSGWPSAGETVSKVGTPGDNVTVLANLAQVDIPTVSIGIIKDGVLETLIGSRGNWQMDARIGEPVIMTFEFHGPARTSFTDIGVQSGVIFESKVPPVFLSAALITGHEGDTTSSADYTPRASAISLNLNHEIGMRQSVSEADGILEAMITGRNASGTFDPELDLEASFPFMQDFLDGDVWRAKFQIGTVAANQFLVTIPGMQTNTAPTGDREGISTRDIGFRASAGHWTNATDKPGEDNEVVITYLL